MKILWRKACRLFALALSLSLLLTSLGCADAFNQIIQKDPEPTNEPANVTVLALNVAYYDGAYTADHLADDPTLLPKLNYTNQSMIEDYSFAKRADRLESLLKYYNPDVFFLNEFNFAWWKEVISDPDSILKSLPKYAYVESRSTGSSKNGEGKKYKDLYNMVFYDQERFTMVENGTFVTCQTWGGWYDHCTWAKLVERETGQTAVYAAIHVQTVPSGDQHVERAVKSLQAATVAVEKLNEIANGLPIIIGGDFNTTETSRGYRTYEYMVGAAGFKDSRYAAPQTDASGTARIWGSSLNNNGNRIDYIFVNGASVKKYEVAKGSFLKDNTYVPVVSSDDLKPGKACDYYDVSDHLPIVSQIILKGAQSTPAQAYENPVGKDDVVATPTGSYTENGGTAEKITFNFADALNYIGKVNQQGYSASLVEDETYGTVLKLTAKEHITGGYISIDYGALMEACGLTPVDATEYNKVKITYLADASYSAEGSILKLGVLREGSLYPTANNSQSLTVYSKWYTQTLYYSSMSSEVKGPVNALSLYNANGAVMGDTIYIASIEFLK